MKDQSTCRIAWDSGLHSGLEREDRELANMMTSQHANKRAMYIWSANLSIIEVEHLEFVLWAL
jgi:hypothetical protein